MPDSASTPTAGDRSQPLSAVAPELRAGIDLFPDIDFTQGLDAFRSGFDARERPPGPPELDAVHCEERKIPGANGAPDVRILLYRPPGAASGPRPALLHIHGGGFVLGAPEINDLANRAAALAHDCVVASVAYRLAPETRYPGALEDCYAALSWLRDSAETLGLDPARIAVAGESAGGGHAAALALYARDRGGPAIRLLVLDAPMLDDRTCAMADPHPHVGHFVWTPDKNHFGWEALLGAAPGGADLAGAPARAEDLTGMPPTYIAVGALDLFLEEDLEFARRLTRAGAPVELHVTPGAYHGYGMAGATPQIVQATALKNAALARAFAASAA